MKGEPIYYVSKIARAWGIPKTQVLDIIDDLEILLRLDESRQRNKEYVNEAGLLLLEEVSADMEAVPGLMASEVTQDVLKEPTYDSTGCVFGISYLNDLLSKSTTELGEMATKAKDELERIEYALDLIRTQVAEIELTQELEGICTKLEKAGLNSKEIVSEILAKARSTAAQAPGKKVDPAQAAKQFFAPGTVITPAQVQQPVEAPKHSEDEARRIIEEANKKAEEAGEQEVVTIQPSSRMPGTQSIRIRKDREFGNIASGSSVVF